MFTQIDDDLNTQKDRTDKHKELLLVYGRQLRDQKVVNQELNSRVVALEEEARVREGQVNDLVNVTFSDFETLRQRLSPKRPTS